MSEPASITSEQFAALQKEMRDGFTELREAQADLAKARTPEEKQEARADVAEAKEDLDDLAKRMGIPTELLRKAKDDAEYTRMKPFLERYMNELADEEDETSEASKADDQQGKKDGDKASEQKPPKESKPKEDSAPVAEHWSERTLTPTGLK